MNSISRSGSESRAASRWLVYGLIPLVGGSVPMRVTLNSWLFLVEAPFTAKAHGLGVVLAGAVRLLLPCFKLLAPACSS